MNNTIIEQVTSVTLNKETVDLIKTTQDDVISSISHKIRLLLEINVKKCVENSINTLILQNQDNILNNLNQEIDKMKNTIEDTVLSEINFNKIDNKKNFIQKLFS